MADGGRFPVLYWASIALLLLMLAFTGWYFLQNHHPLCRNSVDDVLVRGQLNRFWREGRILVLSWLPESAIRAYLKTELGEDYQVFSPETCSGDLVASVQSRGEGNWLLRLSENCYERLLHMDTEDADVLFLLMPEQGQNGIPSILACGSGRFVSQG